ncbi:MAG: AraC family transcriptional regulator [Myxococcales bacterium]|nr:AraC family transcriptional regulator [Myxococcales bacterium]
MGEPSGKAAISNGLRVSGAWTRGVVYAFRRLGLDVEALCKDIGVDLEVFTDTAGRPPRDSLGRLWRAGLAASGDRFLGLSAAEVWDVRADHLVVLLLTSAESIGEGLEASMRYQELLSQGRVVTLGEHPDYHAIQLNKIEHELPITVHEVEFTAVVITKMLRFATDNRFEAHEVQFEHPYRGQIQKYSHAFGCSVTFGHERTMILADDRSWSLPLAHGNSVLHDQLRTMAQELHAELDHHSFIDTVRDRIKRLLPRGQSSIEAVASELRMTPRTLQRRLQEDGTSFRALMDATRKSILVASFERKQTPNEIMRHAGYTNPRSFRRAVKRWNLLDFP